MNGIIASLLLLLAALSSWADTITIGQTSVLGSSDFGNANLLLGQSATLSQTATIQSMSFYVTAAVGDLVLGIYDSINGGPGHLLASTGAFTPILGWNTQAVTSPVALAPGTYWLAYFPSDNGLSFVYTNTGQWYEDPMTFSGSMPGTFVSTHGDVGNWSLYATLIPGGTPTPTPSPDKTTIPPALNIVDANRDVWTLSGGVVLRNGSAAGYSANVILVAYVSGKIWQENNANLWWYWNGAMWIAGANPLPRPTLSPSPGAGLTLFGGVQQPCGGWSFPDPLWKPMSQGAATGNQFPVNWYRDEFAAGIGNAGNTTISGFQALWGPISTYCHSNGINGPCVQLHYPGHMPGSWTGAGGLASYVQWLQALAPYLTAGTYEITTNESFSSNGSAQNSDAIFKADKTAYLGAAWAGTGSTGWDGLIGLIKLQRKYLPAGVLLGVNDFNICSFDSGSTLFNEQTAINAYRICANNGAPMDWLGCEGYGSVMPSGGGDIVAAMSAAIQMSGRNW